MVGTSASAVWQFRVPDRNTVRDLSWGSVFDPNGDGFSDVLIGAPAATSGAGAAHIVYGGMAGLGSMLTNLSAAPGGTGLGASTASAGDFNGDGFVDGIVSAPTGTSGLISLFPGGAGGMSTTWRASLSSTTGQGTALSAAGDIDGDGYADFVAGNPSEFSGMGIVWIAFGDPSTTFARPRVSINGPLAGSNFGAAVAADGDVNCDGHPDLVVGAPSDATNTGRVYVYYGNGTAFASATAVTLNAPDPAGRFGSALALGDVNADGCSDLVVGAPAFNSNVGRGYVYLGGGSGILTAPIATLNPSTGSGTPLWAAAVGFGDVNADGYFDVIVGAPGVSTVATYLGNGAALLSLSMMTTSASGGLVGASVSSLSNVNGDGYDDLVAGAPSARAGLVSVVGAVFWQTATGTGFSAATGIYGPDGSNSNFGRSISLFIAPRRRYFFAG
jgi:hypothetical protein